MNISKVEFLAAVEACKSHILTYSRLKREFSAFSGRVDPNFCVHRDEIEVNGGKDIYKAVTNEQATNNYNGFGYDASTNASF